MARPGLQYACLMNHTLVSVLWVFSMACVVSSFYSWVGRKDLPHGYHMLELVGCVLYVPVFFVTITAALWWNQRGWYLLYLILWIPLVLVVILMVVMSHRLGIFNEESDRGCCHIQYVAMGTMVVYLPLSILALPSVD